MKISNFRLTEIIGNSPISWKFKGLIDIQTGLFFKKTETREVFKSYAGNWCFIDDGKWTPNDDVENLARSYAAKQGKDLENCVSMQEELMK